MDAHTRRDIMLPTTTKDWMISLAPVALFIVAVLTKGVA